MEEVSLNQALAILKNRNRALEVNHLIGSRDIANQEVEEICESIDKFVIPTFEKALEEREELKKKIKALDKALKILKQKRDNAQNDFKNLKCEKDNVSKHIALKNQIDTYTDCIATIEAEMEIK